MGTVGREVASRYRPCGQVMKSLRMIRDHRGAPTLPSRVSALAAENRVLHERAERFRDMAEMERNAMNNIMKFFEYVHLPENLQAVSRPIGELAAEMNARIPDSAEKTAGLRKLLEAKDCFVRASL